ncbi:MAG: ABC transporter permease [Nitrososphaerales archaeon]
MENQNTAKNTVPGSMAQVGVTMKYTFLDYLRSRRFFILLGIAVLIGVLLTVVIGYYRPRFILSSDLAFYSIWWTFVRVFVIVLSGIFFGGDAISGEFQNKTGYFTLSNPVRRSSVYIGKWLSAFIASSLVLAVSAAIPIANQLYYFGATFPYQFGDALALSWVYLAAVLGLTFFFSSLFKASSMSILTSAILLLFGFFFIENIVQGLVGIEPWFILDYGSSIIGNVMSVPYPTAAAAGGGFVASIPEGLAIMGAYFLITSILGLLLFERKEFN